LLAEAGGARLGAMGGAVAATMPHIATPSPAPTLAPTPPPMPVAMNDGRAVVAPIAKQIAGPSKLAVFNHKGGTGKTTTTVSIAAGLAMRGFKVLLVDTDSQGNVGVSLGIKAERTLYHVLVMGLRPQDVAVKVRENLDLLPSNETL